MSCSGRDMQNVWHCMMEQCLSHCWMFTLHCKCTIEQCLGQCWMFTLYDGTVPQSVLNACNWSASVRTECLHCTMEQCLASAECWHCMMELCLASAECLYCTMEYCLGHCCIFTLHYKYMTEQCLWQCWMFTLHDGTVPRSVLNDCKVQWNSALISAECLHCMKE